MGGLAIRSHGEPGAPALRPARQFDAGSQVCSSPSSLRPCAVLISPRACPRAQCRARVTDSPCLGDVLRWRCALLARLQLSSNRPLSPRRLPVAPLRTWEVTQANSRRPTPVPSPGGASAVGADRRPRHTRTRSNSALSSEKPAVLHFRARPTRDIGSVAASGRKLLRLQQPALSRSADEPFDAKPDLGDDQRDEHDLVRVFSIWSRPSAVTHSGR